jgi:alkylation response protein AidB-like acyl-CoA dehydrogenase
MYTKFTEEQDMLKRSARKFMEEECPPEFIREMWDGEEGITEEVWNKMAELGWMGLLVPEEYDGMGMSFMDLAVVFEEMGRAPMTGPFFSTVILGGETIRLAGTEEQKKSLLPQLAMGEIKVTLALLECDQALSPGSLISMKASTSGDGYTLNGVKLFVPDAHVSDYIICAARTDNGDGPEGISLFVVDAKSDGVTIDLLNTMDKGRKQCEVKFDNVSLSADAVLGEKGKAWPVIEKISDIANAALCMEMVGGAEKCLELSVEYAQTRIAFNQPIGSYQAIKHMCADMMLTVESSKSVAYYASYALSDDLSDASEAVSMAKAYCSDSYRNATGDTIQILGGIGFTWEHDAHHYFKRARCNEHMFGDASFHRERLVQMKENA